MAWCQIPHQKKNYSINQLMMKNIPALILLLILGMGCSQEEAKDAAATELVSPSEVVVLQIVAVVTSLALIG